MMNKSIFTPQSLDGLRPHPMEPYDSPGALSAIREQCAGWENDPEKRAYLQFRLESYLSTHYGRNTKQIRRAKRLLKKLG